MGSLKKEKILLHQMVLEIQINYSSTLIYTNYIVTQVFEIQFYVQFFIDFLRKIHSFDNNLYLYSGHFS